MTAEQQIDIDRVRALWATAPTSSVIGMLAAVMCFIVFYAQEGGVTMLLVVAFVGANQAARVVLARRYAREPDDPARTAIWAQRYTWTMIAGGLIWGSLSVYLFRSDDTARQIYLIVAAYGISSGATAPNAYHPPAMLWFIATTLLPLTVRVFLEGGLVYGLLTFALLMQVVFMVLFGLGMNRLLMGSIRTRYENTRLVQELAEKSEALARESRAKTQFFAAASHDLRQPLHALGYYTSLLTPSDQDAPKVRRIEECVESLDALLEGTLNIARLDAGQVQPQIGPVNIGALITRMAALYDAAATSRGLRLRMHAPALWAISDPNLLERILSNLLVNALRYTHSGGVLLAVRPAGQGLRLQVVDTGVGIAPADQARIFDEYVQLQNAHRDSTRGVGLGLATVRRLCTLLDHPIRVRSRPGRGSVFELRLPATKAQALAIPEPSPSGARLQGRVLVVEDHDLSRESLSATLVAWGLQCDSVADGPAALKRAAEGHYDAVLADWRLAGPLNGSEVLAAVRRQQPNLALLALITGESGASLGEIADGIEVLRKPFRAIRLRALLTARLGHATHPPQPRVP